MSERPPHRRPATFKLDDPGVVVMDPDDASRPARGTIQITPETDRRCCRYWSSAHPSRAAGIRWGTVFWSALGGLIILGVGLGVTRLIEDLFARSESLGVLGSALALIAALAFVVVVTREAVGLIRRATIESCICARPSARQRRSRRSRAVIQDLLKVAHQNPHLARARATLQSHADDIIDGAI